MGASSVGGWLVFPNLAHCPPTATDSAERFLDNKKPESLFKGLSGFYGIASDFKMVGGVGIEPTTPAV